MPFKLTAMGLPGMSFAFLPHVFQINDRFIFWQMTRSLECQPITSCSAAKSDALNFVL
jgi:hypothetical protein